MTFTRLHTSLALGITTIVSAFMVSSPAYALRDENCFPHERIAQDISSHFTLEYEDPTQTYTHCEWDDLAYTVMRGILFLKDLPPLSEEKDAFVRLITKESPYEYFSRRIDKVVIHTPKSKNCSSKGTMAYVSGNPSSDKTVHVCPWLANSRPSFVASVLIHETRHHDDDGHPHIDCKGGPLDGLENVCDLGFHGQGAHATTFEFNVRISRNHAVSTPERLKARAQAARIPIDYFNVKPFGLEEGAFLHDVEGPVWFFNGDSLAPVNEQISSSAVVSLVANESRVRNNFAVFDPAIPSYKEYENAPELSPNEWAGFNDYYLNVLRQHERKAMIDVVYGSNYDCMLFPKWISCWDAQREEIREQHSFDLPLVVSNFFYTPKSKINTSATIMIQTVDGHYIPLPKTFDEFKKLGTNNLTYSNDGVTAFKSLAPWKDGFEIGVTRDGLLHIADPAAMTMSQPEGLENRRFKKVLGPVWWSKYLHEI